MVHLAQGIEEQVRVEGNKYSIDILYNLLTALFRSQRKRRDAEGSGAGEEDYDYGDDEEEPQP